MGIRSYFPNKGYDSVALIADEILLKCHLSNGISCCTDKQQECHQSKKGLSSHRRQKERPSQNYLELTINTSCKKNPDPESECN
jgi:hypothetical protein